MSEYIVDICRGNNPQRNFAIDATEGHVVNLITKRWNICALCRVNLDDQNIVSIRVKMRRQLKRERRKPTLIFAESDAVDPDRRCRHHAFEIDKDAFTSSVSRILEATPIGRDKLIILVVEVVPWKTHIRVRNDDAFKRRVIKPWSVCAFNFRWMIAPVAIDRNNRACRTALRR